jgi:hypothetical protein
MKITIARLRNNINYKQPLHDVMDSFFELFKEYIQKNQQHTYGVCNFGWNLSPQAFKNKKKSVEDIIDADVILIPSENEFHQHIDGYLDPRHKERSDVFVREIGSHLKDKHVILLRSDRADDEDLYRNRVFEDQPIGKISILDETDLPGGLHGMKYHFIKENLSPKLFDEEQKYDFVYWGCDKRKLIDKVESGDERHLVIKKIKKDAKIKTYFIGKYNSIVPDQPIDTMYNLLPVLTEGKSTLCFNWLDPTAVTSRYHEALACGIFPFVWKNYDCNNTLVADQWQRVNSVEELYNKLPEVEKRFDDIEKYYIENTMKPKSWYYENFEKRLNELLQI